MSILVGKETRLVVHGITGKEGSYHARACRDYGTNLVAGVVPGKGGQDFEGTPIFDTVAEAIKQTGANCSLVFVPPAFAADSITEAIEAGMPLIIAITEGIPVLDMVPVKRLLQTKPDVRLIGPNCPGVMSPGKAKVGIMPAPIHREGSIGVVSRSGTLTYEVVAQLTSLGLGQSTAVGIGGDPINGTSFVDVLEMFEADEQTEAVIMIGEIGGNAEQDAAAYVQQHMSKPVVGFVAGQTAPPGRRMGHAGAIISGAGGTAKDKMEAMRAAGFTVVQSPAEMGEAMAKRLGR